MRSCEEERLLGDDRARWGRDCGEDGGETWRWKLCGLLHCGVGGLLASDGVTGLG